MSVHSAETTPTIAASVNNPEKKPVEAETEAEAGVEEKKNTYLHGFRLVVVFVGLALTFFIIILDQTILAPAIPVIASDFNAVKSIGWISSSYFLTQCSSILLWGQVLALFDPKTPLLLSIAIFEVGSLIAAVSQNFVTLVVGRSVAGIGGAAIIVAATSIISVVVEMKRRPVFFGCFGMIFVLGSSLGPIIGGSFTSNVTWRWCFYVNLPIGGLSMFAVWFCIPKIKAPPTPTREPSLGIRALRKVFGERPILESQNLISRICGLDWAGCIFVLGGVASLTLALLTGGSSGWNDRTVIIGFVFAGFALILLVLWEALIMKGNGMVPYRVIRYRSVLGSAGLGFTRMMNSVVIVTYLPTFFQATRHQSAIQSGISTLPYAIGMGVFSMGGAVIVQVTGRYKWALCLGSAVSAVGAGLLYMIHVDTSYAQIAGFQIIGAFGSGLVQMNAILAAQAEMDANNLSADIPQATALVSFLQLLGATCGGSIGGALITNGIHKYLPSDFSQETVQAVLQSVEAIWSLPASEQASAIAAYARALDDAFIAGAAAGALGVVFALICRDINIKGKKFK